MYDLPIHHPKRKWAGLSVCVKCKIAYGPPTMFEEWDTVQFNIASCPFCDTPTVRWSGTADWANPKTLLDEGDEADNVTTDLRRRFARVTSTCRECSQSKSEKELYQVIRQQEKEESQETSSTTESSTSGEAVCPNCGSDVSDRDNYCKDCAENLSE